MKTKKVPVEVLAPAIGEAKAIKAHEVLEKVLLRAFPIEEDRMRFLEECAISNAMLAQGRFVDTYSEMTPSEAAKAFALFTGKAIELRKARIADYREPQISIGVILNLQQTLEKLTNEK